MDYAEFKRQIQKSGLTVAKFSTLLSVRANSLSNLRKRPSVPDAYAAVAVLCADAKERGVDFLHLLATKGIGVIPSVTNIDEYRMRTNRKPGGEK
jgi:hypothetical protein